MEFLNVGEKAKSFSVKDQNGKKHSLKDYAGKWIILYFYPKDMTPGCTNQACSVQEVFPKFKKGRVVVLGASSDSTESHNKFAEKYGLTFPLLIDAGKKVMQKYGAVTTKDSKGEQVLKTVRSTFVINPEGKIAKVYKKVKTQTHGTDLMEDLIKLKAEFKEELKARAKAIKDKAKVKIEKEKQKIAKLKAKEKAAKAKLKAKEKSAKAKLAKKANPLKTKKLVITKTKPAAKKAVAVKKTAAKKTKAVAKKVVTKKKVVAKKKKK